MMCELVRAETDAKILIDGAQAIAHQKVDVQAIDCDFYCFSGHKVFGPTGTGVLYAKEKHLLNMNPYKVGGQMVSKVSYPNSEWSEIPLKFEAGTPNIAGVIGVGRKARSVDLLLRLLPDPPIILGCSEYQFADWLVGYC